MDSLPISSDAAMMIIYVVIALTVLAFMTVLHGYRLFGVLSIPNNKIGIVTKKFTMFGAHRRLPDGHIVALSGEAGVQADTLAPGLYFFYYPWQFRVERVPFTEVPASQVGIVEARDGAPLPVGRILAAAVDCDVFQDARKFLERGGQRGGQLAVCPPGVYRINTSVFRVQLVPAVDIPQGQIGIVTTLEGTPLPTNEIAGHEVAGHSSFQDADRFVRAGGYKGVQEQVMLAGRYYLNPRFVKVDAAELTNVAIGQVGVVVAFVGAPGADVTGTDFTHGNIVSRGQKGVWAEPQDPGRYPINPRTMAVELVPTTNIVLNWATGKTEAHNLDKNLSTITVRSADGFTFNLDVSQIIHVSRENAPKVIARFGSMANLVTQVLEPTIGNYFRNAAQGSDVIAFLTSRSERQLEATNFIRAALEKYNVMAVDTLIGDITPPAALMETLTERKIATQMQETYKVQQTAQVERQELARATAEADTRPQVIAASRAAEVAKLTAEATVSKARGDADARKLAAEGEAAYVTATGAAEASRTTAVGEAEAAVLKKKVDAVGADKYAMMNVVDALAANKVALVPQIVAGGGGDRSGLLEAFVGNLLGRTVSDPGAGRGQ